MNIEEIIEARLSGQTIDYNEDLATQHKNVLAAHQALTFVLGETIVSDPDREPPTLTSDYEIIGELGRGGMGVVYLARQKSLSREIAVKVLRLRSESRDRFLKRFLDEARHMAQLRHPNIVAVHEVGQTGDEPYFTMDFVAGESLSHRLSRGALSPAQAIRILKQVVAAVQHAHERGIIHRDLKPGNILLDSDSTAYVTDFGLAREVEGGSEITRSGELVGTPAYMAPEQAMGQVDRIGEATDVHALGAVMYESLTGRPPFGNDAVAVVFSRILNHQPVAPRQLNRRIPRDLETICLKCLEKDPGLRYATAQALGEDLRRFEVGDPIAARRPGPVTRALRSIRKNGKMIATAGVTAIIATGLTLHFAIPTSDTLRSWGKEREAKGDYVGALDVYRRAWEKSEGEARHAARADVIRCIRKANDPKSALAAARAVIVEDPYTSFGVLDHLVAQTVVAELNARTGGSVAAARKESDRDLLELAETRLKLFLNSSHGSAVERKNAEDSLAAVGGVLHEHTHGAPVEYVEDVPDYRLPDGTDFELEKVANDSKTSPWERGKAEYVLAVRAQKAGNKQLALAAASRAFELVRSVYPMYSGVAASTVIAPMVASRIGSEPVEAILLRKSHELLSTLDPQRPSALTGGIRFVLKGIEIPAELNLCAQLKLRAPDALKDPTFLPQSTVPFIANRAEVGIADGTYEMQMHASSSSIPSGFERFVRLMEVDFDRLPKTVTIADGKITELEVPVRQMDELTLIGPETGSSFDPSTDVFSWKPVAGAASYRLLISLQQDYKNGKRTTGLANIKVHTPRVCLGTIDDADIIRTKSKFTAGALLTWSVTAYDKSDRRIAVSREYSRPLVLAKALER